MSSEAESLWNPHFWKSANSSWPKPWASCPSFGVSPGVSRRLDWDPPYFCSDFMSQARKKCHSSQNLVHLYSLRIVPIFPFHSHLHPGNGTSSLAEHGESLSVLRCLFQKHTTINCSALFFLFKLSETSWVSQRSQGISWGGIWMLWNKCHFPRGSRVTWMGAHIRASAELHY